MQCNSKLNSSATEAKKREWVTETSLHCVWHMSAEKEIHHRWAAFGLWPSFLWGAVDRHPFLHTHRHKNATTVMYTKKNMCRQLNLRLQSMSLQGKVSEESTNIIFFLKTHAGCSIKVNWSVERFKLAMHACKFFFLQLYFQTFLMDLCKTRNSEF